MVNKSLLRWIPTVQFNTSRIPSLFSLIIFANHYQSIERLNSPCSTRVLFLNSVHIIVAHRYGPKLAFYWSIQLLGNSRPLFSTLFMDNLNLSIVVGNVGLLSIKNVTSLGHCPSWEENGSFELSSDSMQLSFENDSFSHFKLLFQTSPTQQ